MGGRRLTCRIPLHGCLSYCGLAMTVNCTVTAFPIVLDPPTL